VDARVKYGLGATAVLALIAAASGGSSKRKDETSTEDKTPRMGFAPAVSDLTRYVSDHCDHGTLYVSRRGDTILGTGPKAVAYRALVSAAKAAGVEDAQRFASKGWRKAAYAALLVASQHNAQHCAGDLDARKHFVNHAGLGLDLRTGTLLWLPLLDLDQLAQSGAVVPAEWEDGVKTVELPPELRA